MKKKYNILLACILSVISISGFSQIKLTDLKPAWDTIKVCENPDKGWYHHYYDNGTGTYLLKNDSDLLNFPGMDHLYVRLSWSHFEPEEGKFDWHWIDELKEKWIPQGFRISFRVTCKETYEEYATPEWVRKAGAKGKSAEFEGRKMWIPDYGDSIFLSKLQAFHKAFAARYDSQPWVVYTDIGSIGSWGEGHDWPDFSYLASVPVTLKHIDMYRACYPKTQLVASDELAHQGRNYFEKFDRTAAGDDSVRIYIEKNGITWRDDTPLVGYFVDRWAESFCVVRPNYFQETYKHRFTVLEADHYGAVKGLGNWKGKNGNEKGAEILKGAMKLMHPTYIGFHGYIEDYMRDNPDLIKELANKCGYWYFPSQIEYPEKVKRGSRLNLKIGWENRGIAPAYNQYILEMKLVGANTTTFVLPESDNRNWQDGELAKENYSIKVPRDIAKGSYEICFRLKDPKSGRSVELGLKNSLRDMEGFYLFEKVVVN